MTFTQMLIAPPWKKQGTVGPFWDPLSLEHRLPRDLVFVIYILSVAPGSSPFRRIPQTDGSIAHSKRKRKAFSLYHMLGLCGKGNHHGSLTIYCAYERKGLPESSACAIICAGMKFSRGESLNRLLS